MSQELNYIDDRPFLDDVNIDLISFDKKIRQYPNSQCNSKNYNQDGDITLSNFHFSTNNINNNNLSISNLSSIQKNNSDNNNFFDDGQAINNLFPNNDNKKSKIHHLVMENKDYLETNFGYMTKNNSYQYYFIFIDDEGKFHLQIKYSFGKDLYPNQMAPYNILNPIRDYNYFENLLNKNQVLEIKIKYNNKNIQKYLHFTVGRKGGEDTKYAEINGKIKEYCKNYGIFL